jgi:hypothetical protein
MINNEAIVKSKTHAISYIRFSSAKQGAESGGDSYRRQLERTQEYCTEHELILNETRYADLGVSGWTGKNIESGAMGDFMAALKADKIPNKEKTLLIVENFDRFSRLKPRLVYNKLAEIIEAGMDVVTLEDGKIHTKETLDDFANLISSLAIMQRANEESTRKSGMIRRKKAEQRKQAMAGNGIITSNCPAWLRVKADKSGFEVIPERVKIVKRIIQWVKAGKGKREIARMLDAENIPTWSSMKNWKTKETKKWAKHWRDNYVLELIRSRTLLGELQPLKKKNPHGEPIRNYYPAIINEATWVEIQPKRTKGFNAGPQTDANNLFSGLLFDGYNPDYRMKFFLTNKEKNYIYLTSDFASVDPLYLEREQAIAKGKKPGPRPLSGMSIKYQEFEQHFLANFQDIDFRNLLPAKSDAEATRLTLLEKEKKENDKALANLLKALEAGEPSALVMAQIHKREDTERRLAKEIEAATRNERRERYAADSFEAEQERMEELYGAQTPEVRLALRALLHRIIERIDIYTEGLLDEVPDHLKTMVYPDRCGMMCYSVKLVGGYKIWFWWDGSNYWEQGDAKTPSLIHSMEISRGPVVKMKSKIPKDLLPRGHRRQSAERKPKLAH